MLELDKMKITTRPFTSMRFLLDIYAKQHEIMVDNDNLKEVTDIVANIMYNQHGFIPERIIVNGRQFMGYFNVNFDSELYMQFENDNPNLRNPVPMATIGFPN